MQVCPSFPPLTLLSLQHPPLPQYSSVVLQKLQLLCSHYYLTVLGNAVALTNVMCICVSPALAAATSPSCSVSPVHLLQTVLVLNSEKTTVERNNSNLEVSRSRPGQEEPVQNHLLVRFSAGRVRLQEDFSFPNIAVFADHQPVLHPLLPAGDEREGVRVRLEGLPVLQEQHL